MKISNKAFAVMCGWFSSARVEPEDLDADSQGGDSKNNVGRQLRADQSPASGSVKVGGIWRPPGLLKNWMFVERALSISLGAWLLYAAIPHIINPYYFLGTVSSYQLSTRS